MMESVMLGRMSCAMANQIAVGQASDAKAMGVPMHPEMKMLAGIGTRGRHRNHAWRDLEQKLGLEECNLPEPLYIPMPLLDNSRHPPAVVWGEWPIFLLQDLLHCLHRHHPDEFRRRFLGGQDDSVLERYWGALRADDPRLANHPVTRQFGWRKCSIPGRLHGDGVPYGKSKLANMTVNNVSSVLSTGDSIDCLNLWWWFPKAIACIQATHGCDSWDRLWKAAIWDLLCCVRGEFLSFDWDGRTITAGHPRFGKTGRIMGQYLFPVIQATNDTEHNVNFLKMKHWKSLEPCNWCQASGSRESSMPYSDFQDDSEWIALQTTVEDWFANPIDHPLWQAQHLIGITIWCVCLDILHVLDLGVLQYFLGSCIWTLVWESKLPGGLLERQDHVWRLLCNEFDILGTDLSQRLPREDFFGVFGKQRGPNPSSFPALSAKAARIRHTLPAMQRVAQKIHADQQLDEDEHVLQRDALGALTEFYAIVYAGGHVLAEAAAERIIDVVDAFLRKQNSLAMIYWGKNMKHYNVTFKSHLFWHMARHCKFFNPRHGWAYRDESFVGSVAVVVKSVISGNGQRKSGRALAVKWRRLQWFRLRRRQGAVYRDLDVH